MAPAKRPAAAGTRRTPSCSRLSTLEKAAVAFLCCAVVLRPVVGGARFDFDHAPAPLFRDPKFDGATDPAVVYDETNKVGGTSMESVSIESMEDRKPCAPPTLACLCKPTIGPTFSSIPTPPSPASIRPAISPTPYRLHRCLPPLPPRLRPPPPPTRRRFPRQRAAAPGLGASLHAAARVGSNPTQPYLVRGDRDRRGRLL